MTYTAISSALAMNSSHSSAFPGVAQGRPWWIQLLPNVIWWGLYPEGVGRLWYAWMARHILVSQLRLRRSRCSFST